MPVPTPQLEHIGRIFAEAWVEASDVSQLREIYHDDAVLVSPLFPSPIEGREAIMQCFEGLFAGIPQGLSFEILAILPGVDMLNVFWSLGESWGADTLLLGDDGTIITHYDTGPHEAARDG